MATSWTTRAGDPLSTALASPALARLVTHFTLHGDRPQHFRALQRHTRLGVASLQRELARLESMSVISVSRRDRQVEYEANILNARWLALRDMVRQFADHADVLRDALNAVPGIATAFVFGSVARGTARVDSDIDVFIVGDAVDDEVLSRESLNVNILLDREVDAALYTSSDLATQIARGNRFVRNVLAGPKRWLIGDANALPAAATSLTGGGLAGAAAGSSAA